MLQIWPAVTRFRASVDRTEFAYFLMHKSSYILAAVVWWININFIKTLVNLEWDFFFLYIYLIKPIKKKLITLIHTRSKSYGGCRCIILHLDWNNWNKETDKHKLQHHHHNRAMENWQWMLTLARNTFIKPTTRTVKQLWWVSIQNFAIPILPYEGKIYVLVSQWPTIPKKIVNLLDHEIPS